METFLSTLYCGELDDVQYLCILGLSLYKKLKQGYGSGSGTDMHFHDVRYVTHVHILEQAILSPVLDKFLKAISINNLNLENSHGKSLLGELKKF